MTLSFKSLYEVEILVNAEFDDWPTRPKDGRFPVLHTKTLGFHIAEASTGERAIAVAMGQIGGTIIHADPWDASRTYEGRVISKSVERLIRRKYDAPVDQEIIVDNGALLTA